VIRERQIIFHGHYFQEFYLEVSDNVKEKIGFVFRVIKTVDQIPEKFLKHIEGTEGFERLGDIANMNNKEKSN
jgi:hypothetical protein